MQYCSFLLQYCMQFNEANSSIATEHRREIKLRVSPKLNSDAWLIAVYVLATLHRMKARDRLEQQATVGSQSI